MNYSALEDSLSESSRYGCNYDLHNNRRKHAARISKVFFYYYVLRSLNEYVAQAQTLTGGFYVTGHSLHRRDLLYRADSLSWLSLRWEQPWQTIISGYYGDGYLLPSTELINDSYTFYMFIQFSFRLYLQVPVNGSFFILSTFYDFRFNPFSNLDLIANKTIK